MCSNLVLKIHSTEMSQMWAEETVAVHKVITESSEQLCVFYNEVMQETEFRRSSPRVHKTQMILRLF